VDGSSLRLRVRVLAVLFTAVYAVLAGAHPAGAVTINEFTTGISNPTLETAAGPDGAVWFTEGVTSSSIVGRIAPNGTVKEFSAGITQNSEPLGITAGPDGNLWFTEELGNSIGRITPSGVVTEFSNASSGGSRPADITTGPDGNLWFTMVSGNIGRITPSGVITVFSAGISSGSQPLGITAGPDGDVWFTESQGNRIGRITPTGVVTEFPTGTPTGQPRGIALGPDGNLWFTDNAGPRIERMTPSGAVTVFTGLTSFTSLVTPGPDGNVWFTEHDGNIVGSITPSGKVTEYSTGISPGAGPFGITTGADGNLWFAENAANRIGRLRVGTVPPPVFNKSVDLTATSGKVLVEVPGPKTFLPLSAGEQVPLGSIIDVTRGRVQLCSATASAQVQCSTFYGGQFEVTQQAGVTVLVLVGGNFAACPQGAGRAASAARHKLGQHATVRQLWADGKGAFRTQGRFASAAIRGTKWLTSDRCDGTLIRVATGAVAVRDLTRHRSLTLRAPHSYLAPAKR
jgi:streptogramin lyase